MKQKFDHKSVRNYDHIILNIKEKDNGKGNDF